MLYHVHNLRLKPSVGAGVCDARAVATTTSSCSGFTRVPPSCSIVVRDSYRCRRIIRGTVHNDDADTDASRYCLDFDHRADTEYEQSAYAPADDRPLLLSYLSWALLRLRVRRPKPTYMRTDSPAILSPTAGNGEGRSSRTHYNDTLPASVPRCPKEKALKPERRY